MRLTLDELINSDDKAIDSNGVTIVYNTRDEEYLGDIEIDYDQSALKRGFIIKGPESSCC